MSGADFIHLRTHSAYSLLEGAIPLKQLIDLAVKDGQPAIAVTDTGNLFAALEFSEKAAGAGLQPIVGCELQIDFDDGGPGPEALSNLKHPVVVVLATSEVGFANLSRCVSESFLGVPDGEQPHIPLSLLLERGEGLILLTGGPTGPLDCALREGATDIARDRLSTLLSGLGDRLYIELQRHSSGQPPETEVGLLDLAYTQDIPIVATNNCYFPTGDDFEAHDALICIADGRYVAEDDRRRYTAHHAFKSRAEMVKRFSDLPEALENTIEIARRCHYRPLKRKPILPRFAGDEAGEAQELRRQAEAGLGWRLATGGCAPGKTEAEYRERLEIELTIIENMKFPGYFLIVADFIKWAKDRDIAVGPGRGSGAGSLVAYSLTITDLDPLRFDLLFERFLNPERVSMPDFDIDFCQERRDEVITYVQEKYGVDQVAQIITFGSLQARAVLRDVGRVLQMPYGQVDRLCKMVPNNPANPTTLPQAIEGEPRLREAIEAEDVVKRLIDIAQRLEGLFRHSSTHAAGIVIGDRPLVDLVPIYRDPRSDMPVTQYNMKWVEQAGLVKFDFLGLKTLTVLEKALEAIADQGETIDLATIPLDDKRTFDMLSRGETVGVFQLESAGMRKALIEMVPDRFEDIIAIVALYRPGPMANIPTYCARKHEQEEPDYLHPLLEPILRETFGVIIYQEQVMQIAQVLSGYSLGEADLLRRAMGKKIKAEMDVQRERFVTGALERGLDKARANTIFDLLAKFADYGFNKSHAAAYALVAYQTAYLKANYPVAFLAASMTLDMGNTSKLGEFRREAQRLGIEVVPPSIQVSEVDFKVTKDSIIYALGAIKGVGHQAAESLVAARGDRPFASLGDVSARIEPRSLNKRTLESLVASGAFDRLSPDRGRLHNGIDRVLAEANRLHSDRESGQDELFGGDPGASTIELPDGATWEQAELLQREYAAIGFYLSAHPLDVYEEIFKRMRVQMWSGFVQSVKSGAAVGRLAGTVLARQERRTRTGNKMGIFQISDPTGQYEAVMFSEGLRNCHDVLVPGKSVLMLVSAEMRQEGVNVRIESAEPLEVASNRISQSLRLFVRDASSVNHISARLTGTRGDGRVSIVVLGERAGHEVEVRLPGRYQVSPAMAGALKAAPGVEHVELV